MWLWAWIIIHTDCIFFASRFMISSVFSSTCCCKSSRSRSNDFSVARISAVSKLCSAFLFSISSIISNRYYDINNYSLWFFEAFLFLLPVSISVSRVSRVYNWQIVSFFLFFFKEPLTLCFNKTHLIYYGYHTPLGFRTFSCFSRWLPKKILWAVCTFFRSDLFRFAPGGENSK